MAEERDEARSVAEGNKHVVKIAHRRSPHYSSDYATMVHIAGPSPDEQYHLLFFSEAAVLTYDKVVVESGVIRETVQDAEGVVAAREDKATISMPLNGLKNLYVSLHRMLTAIGDDIVDEVRKTTSDEKE